MEKLPPEILQNTFTLLSLNDRTVCLRVCRYWWSVLDKYCLFYNVVIYRNIDRFTKFMELMERSPRHAAQVEELYMNDSFPSRFNKRYLCEIFLNVRVLKVSHISGTMRPRCFKSFNEPLVLTHSNSKVQHIADIDCCELASQMLFSNLCGRLESIRLNFYNITYNVHTILAQLKGLPVLIRLRIEQLGMGIDDLDDLHNNLPSVQEFEVVSVTILPGKILDNVVPIPAIEAFTININKVKNIEIHIELYKYMAKKYINARECNIVDYGTKNYSFNDRKHIFESAGLDYLKLITSKSPILTLTCVPDGINVFTALDSINYQWDSLYAISCGGGLLFQDLVQSNQCKYLKTLLLTETLIDSPNFLKNMTALTSFTLISSNKINLTDYLNGCPPNVTDFSIDCPSLKIIPYNTRLTCIQSLSISCKRLTNSLAVVISTSFPKLTKLCISGRLAANISISLHQDSLEEMSIKELEGKCGFTFKSTRQTEPHHYLCENKQVTSASYQDIEHLHNLSVTSFTGKRLDHLILHEHLQ
jgi:hypothetical protein